MEDPRKKERAFTLDLPAFVQGLDERERTFTEQAEVTSLSAEEATLRLRAQVRLGTKLRFAILVPRTFFLEKPLEMSLSGTVVQILPGLSRARDNPLIRLRLDRTYAILSRSL
jgi:hypothetical protein